MAIELIKGTEDLEITCETHRFAKWSFVQCDTSNGIKFKEVRSCVECGKSQIRSVDRVDQDG